MIENLKELGDLYSNIISIIGMGMQGTLVQITDETIIIMNDSRLLMKDIIRLDDFIGTRGMIEARDSMLIITYSLEKE